LYLSVLKDCTDKLKSAISVRFVKIRITVGTPDAAQTAVLYGAVAQSVAYLTEFIRSFAKVSKQQDIDITPDFLHEETKADIQIRLSTNAAKLLGLGIKLVLSLLREKMKRQYKSPKKAGKHYV
ncbi:MAG: DUF2953 domain-containing protein, partial [Clostridia bacterium]|nr:DUF2953 domain-containing protein [Clostridia bacterium]